LEQLPRPYLEFRDRFPELARAYDKLGETAHQSGPLDDKTRQLIKQVLSIGAGNEGSVHPHTRRATQAGATREEVFHVVVLAVTSIGFPSAVAAYTRVTDELKGN
jgi:alkylhydroperoxidase/carboxymuconolactone decarboxylase family protein YurZ